MKKLSLIISLLTASALLSACATATTATPTAFVEISPTLTPTSIPPTATIEPSPTVDPNMPEGATGRDAQGYYMDADGIRYYSETIQIGGDTIQLWMKSQMKNGPIMLYDSQISLHGGPNSIPIDIQSEKDLAIAQQLGLLSHTTNMADYPTTGSRISSVPNGALIGLYDRLTPPSEQSKDSFLAFVGQFNSGSVVLHMMVPDNATDPQTTYTTINWNPVLDGYQEDLTSWNKLDPVKDPSIEEFSSPLPMRIKWVQDGNKLHAIAATSLTTLTEQQKDVLTFAPFYMGFILDKVPVLHVDPSRNTFSHIQSPAGFTDIMVIATLISSDTAVPPFINFGN